MDFTYDAFDEYDCSVEVVAINLFEKIVFRTEDQLYSNTYNTNGEWDFKDLRSIPLLSHLHDTAYWGPTRPFVVIF